MNTQIGNKSFQQWTAYGEASRCISASNIKEKGERVVAIVQWFFKEHKHRLNSIMRTDELRKIIGIYIDIPIKNILQLERILHDLEIENGERSIQIPTPSDWKDLFRDCPLFGYVMDDYWCIRATTKYELALAGYTEKDIYDWKFWHRMTSSMEGVAKLSPLSQQRLLRGCYAQEYYKKQMARFRLSIEAHMNRKNEYRAKTLLDLLNDTDGFKEMWSSSKDLEVNIISNLIGYPVPYYRDNGTLLWTLELSTIIPNTNNYHLIMWAPLNNKTGVYMASFCNEVNESNKFEKNAYFLEDYSSNFSKEQRIALGIETI